MIGHKQRRSDALLCDCFRAHLVPDVEADVSDTPTLEALRQCRDALKDMLMQIGANRENGVDWVCEPIHSDEIRGARAALAAADAALSVPAPSVGAEGLPPLPKAAPINERWLMEHKYTADDMRAYALAALASRPAVDAWQPIETAPKDGTRILIDFGTKGVLQVAWQDRDGDGFAIWCVDDEKFGPYPLRGYIDKPDSPTRPRAWMPTPAARHPAQREGE